MSEDSEDQSGCCSSSPADSAELKLYQAFIFSVPVFFAFVLLLLFYLFYLRRRRVDWSSLRMRANLAQNNDLSRRVELGLKKEVRELLPIIIYKESFSIKDTQCSVCLADYQAEDRLQQMPACGHAFHMDCIDNWLATHATCPLCRLSVLATISVWNESPDTRVANGPEPSDLENTQPRPLGSEESQPTQPSEQIDGNVRIICNSEGDGRSASYVDQGREFERIKNDSMTIEEE